jgi:hypothetical protein
MPGLTNCGQMHAVSCVHGDDRVGYRRDATTARELLEDSERLDELLDSDDDETSVDLDKAWHGLH